MDKHKVSEILRDHGWATNEARGVWEVDGRGNIFIDATRGVQRLDQIKGSITIGFMDAMEAGPLAGEPVRGVKVKLEDASVHEDSVHVGPGQIIPATRSCIFATMLSANPVLVEPLLKLDVRMPVEQVGIITSIIAQKRGRVLSVEQRQHLTHIVGEFPTSESLDLSETIRGATSGRAFWGTEFSRWETIPASLQKSVIQEVRKRKGMSPSPPRPQDLIK